MKTTNKKNTARTRRHKRIRTQIHGTQDKPRLVVYKSNRFVSAQLINDDKGVTLASVSTAPKQGTVEAAREAGESLAKVAADKKISQVVFDRGGFLYAGKIKSLAEGARAGGLIF